MCKRILLLILSMLLILPSCGCQSYDADEDGLSIVTTLFPQYDFARAIIGNKGNVELLLTPGTNSHSFELTAADLSAIINSDIFIYTGPGMEIWVDSIIASLDSSVNVINLSDRVELLCSSHHEDEHDHSGHNHGTYDPHIWTSPIIAINMLTTIYNTVCKLDPDNESYYTANYTSYLEELKAADSEFRKIAKASSDKKLYFSGKYAFTYFSNEYGFDVVAPFNSCSDLQVEDFASLASLIKEMSANRVDYIFYEEFASHDFVGKIAAETGATPYLLHSGHNLTKDEFESGTTYIDILKINANNLREALLNGKTS